MYDKWPELYPASEQKIRIDSGLFPNPIFTRLKFGIFVGGQSEKAKSYN
jgi:hypothetical protein